MSRYYDLMRCRWWVPSVNDDGLERLFEGLDRILTPDEVADLLRMNKAAIYRWLNEGYLPGHKLGNNWRIVRDDLREWMRQGANSRLDGGDVVNGAEPSPGGEQED